MQNLKFKIDKFYFILKFRLILLNFKYLSFININFQDLTRLIELFNLLDLTFLRVKSNKLTFLIKNNYFNNVLKHDYFLLYSNDFKLLSNKKLCKEINTLAFSGYFINNSYINKLEYYYNYYINNYNIIIILINKYINIFIFIIFKYIYILLTILLKLGLKKI